MSDSELPGGDFPAVTDVVTQTGIDAYAQISGDFNPLHVDPVAAAASEFGGIIAHGPIALHAFFRAATEWLGTDALPAGSEVKVTYRAPTRPGDEVTVRLGQLQTAPDGRSELTAECVKQDGTTVVSVTAVLPAGISR
jgi:3-hydroxybutyryl-CoA dehydratase